VAAHRFGVGTTEAMLQLVEFLPPEWQEWAWEQVEIPILTSYAEERIGSTFREFLGILRYQIIEVGRPPVGPYGRGLPAVQRLRALLGLPPSVLPWVEPVRALRLEEIEETEGQVVIDADGPQDPAWDEDSGAEEPIKEVLRRVGGRHMEFDVEDAGLGEYGILNEDDLEYVYCGTGEDSETDDEDDSGDESEDDD
jgi:hypothetical protein